MLPNAALIYIMLLQRPLLLQHLLHPLTSPASLRSALTRTRFHRELLQSTASIYIMLARSALLPQSAPHNAMLQAGHVQRRVGGCSRVQSANERSVRHATSLFSIVTTPRGARKFISCSSQNMKCPQRSCQRRSLTKARRGPGIAFCSSDLHPAAISVAITCNPAAITSCWLVRDQTACFSAPAITSCSFAGNFLPLMPLDIRQMTRMSDCVHRRLCMQKSSPRGGNLVHHCFTKALPAIVLEHCGFGALIISP